MQTSERLLNPESDEPFDGEKTFVSLLHLVDSIVRSVARRYRLTTSDVEELTSLVHLHLIARDYEVLRSFRGRSSMRTFLRAVIVRQCLDYRTTLWGRWRPSAAARRHGHVLVQLEALVMRDELPFDAAYEHLRKTQDVRESIEQLRALLAHLPVRRMRRVCGGQDLDLFQAETREPDEAFNDAAAARRVRAALQQALARLDVRDRQVIVWRFRDEISVAEIARRSGLDQKKLYRRLPRILQGLRLDLSQQGVVGLAC